MTNRIRVFALFLTAAATGMLPLSAQHTLAGCPVFPANNVWNTPVDKLPLDANSAAYISTLGSGRYLHPDFSSSGSGIPFVVVPGSQPKVPIMFTDGAAESDPGPYPVPANAPIEAGGDRHILVLQNSTCVLYELYAVQPSTGGWTASSGAIFNLKSNQLRPSGWTSADAAGLPILPGLLLYDEVASGVIDHAIRMTAPQTRNQYIWPARHKASSLTGTQYPPMGQRFRLKAGFDITPYPADVQVILTALKKYGAILADNGSAWYLSGAPDPRWNDDTLHKLHLVLGANLEAVNEAGLMADPDSGAVLSGPAALASVQLNPLAVTGGAVTTANQVVLSAPAPSGGITVYLSSSNMAAASLPASVLVPAGAASAPFTITSGNVSSSTAVTITAAYLGVSKTATLTVNGVAVRSVTINPASVTGGASASGVVTLSGPAPASGAKVLLASSNTLAATVPASVTIAPGASSGTFSVNTLAQTANSSAGITASYWSNSASASISVLAPASSGAPVPSSVVLLPATIQGGNVTNGYIWLSGSAPAGGLPLTVTTSNPLFKLAASGWTVAAGSNMKYFTVTAPPVTSPTAVTISATAGGVTKTAVLTVNPATIQGLTFSPATVTGGSTVTATIFLGGAAPSGGTAITVASSAPGNAPVPLAVTVPAGSRKVTFAIPSARVSATTGVVITLRQGATAISAKLTVTP